MVTHHLINRHVTILLNIPFIIIQQGNYYTSIQSVQLQDLAKITTCTAINVSDIRVKIGAQYGSSTSLSLNKIMDAVLDFFLGHTCIPVDQPKP